MLVIGRDIKLGYHFSLQSIQFPINHTNSLNYIVAGFCKRISDMFGRNFSFSTYIFIPLNSIDP